MMGAGAASLLAHGSELLVVMPGVKNGRACSDLLDASGFGAPAGMRSAAGLDLIPPADIKAARDVIRYRRKLVEHRT